MSPTTTSAAESQWLAQLTVMREAIAQLNLPVQDDNKTAIYGQDLLVRPEDYIPPSKVDDLWDFITPIGEDQEYSDLQESIGSEIEFSKSNSSDLHYGLIWLESKCGELARRRSGLDSCQLQEQIISLLSSEIHGTISL